MRVREGDGEGRQEKEEYRNKGRELVIMNERDLVIKQDKYEEEENRI